MGRRSDHTRSELREMIISEGHRQLSETGFARFSAREVAKRIGYSIGTIYNVFGTYDQLMLAINGRTLDMWLAALGARLGQGGEPPLEAAVRAYFDFALGHRHAWTALYDFRLPEGEAMPAYYAEKVAAITALIVRAVAGAMPEGARGEAPALARSLLASVHGHCFFALNGTFAMLGEDDPVAAAMARVEDGLARYA